MAIGLSENVTTVLFRCTKCGREKRAWYSDSRRSMFKHFQKYKTIEWPCACSPYCDVVMNIVEMYYGTREAPYWRLG
jgi:hypothetical protein